MKNEEVCDISQNCFFQKKKKNTDTIKYKTNELVSQEIL